MIIYQMKYSIVVTSVTRAAQDVKNVVEENNFENQYH